MTDPGRKETWSQSFIQLIKRHVVASVTPSGDAARTELDSHADSPVVGKYARIIWRTEKKVNVSGFTDELGDCVNIPVVHAAISYDDPYTGETSTLIVNNALYFKNMEVNLIPPIMIRLTGADVNECPKFLSRNPSERDHTIWFPCKKRLIHLSLIGITSYINTRLPIEAEIQDRDNHIHLTPNTPEWDPHDTTYASQEDAMMSWDGHLKTMRETPYIFGVKQNVLD